jgi:hypothetical protein
MGSFGSQESDQKSTASSGINKEFLPYAKNALIRAGQVGDQGYVPYMGMDVAVPDSLVNNWQQTADRSAAFNGTPQQDIRSQMPLTTQNGVQGLSSYGGYQDQLSQLQKNYPGLYDYIKSFSIDPVTGKLGSRAFGNMSLGGNGGGGGGGNGGGGGGAKPGAANNGDAFKNWYYTATRDFITQPDLYNNTYGTRAYNG